MNYLAVKPVLIVVGEIYFSSPQKTKPGYLCLFGVCALILKYMHICKYVAEA